MDIEFRQYTVTDKDVVWQLHVDGLNQTGSLTRDRAWDEDLLDIDKNYLGNRGDFLVATSGGEVVGIGGLRMIDDDTAEIKRMRVRIQRQRRGIGTLILRRLMERARELGYRRVVLDTSENQQPAKRLYEKHGFKSYKRAKVKHLDLVFYERDLWLAAGEE